MRTSGTRVRRLRSRDSATRRFAAVEAAFRDNFRLRGEIGARRLRHARRPYGHRALGRPSRCVERRALARDTLVNAYSVGKGITSMLALSLVERGELDLDRPVTTWWPEFGAEGKASTTLRMLLAHRAGLPAVRRPLAPIGDLRLATMTDALAEQAPYWEPGSAHGYHVNTHGFLVGEPIVRRLGKPFGEILRERITGPYGVDFHSGLSAPEHARVATIVLSRRTTSRSPPRRIPARPPRPRPRDRRSRDRRAAARGLLQSAGLLGLRHGQHARVAQRVDPLDQQPRHRPRRRHALRRLPAPRRRDRAALVGAGTCAPKRSARNPMAPTACSASPRASASDSCSRSRPAGSAAATAASGTSAMAAASGFADPECGLAFGYLMNRPGDRWYNPRTMALIDAVYACLGGPTVDLTRLHLHPAAIADRAVHGGGIAVGERMGRQGSRHERAGADDRLLADLDAAQDRDVGGDPAVVADPDGRDLLAPIGIEVVLVGVEDPRARADPDAVAELERPPCCSGGSRSGNPRGRSGCERRERRRGSRARDRSAARYPPRSRPGRPRPRRCVRRRRGARCRRGGRSRARRPGPGRNGTRRDSCSQSGAIERPGWRVARRRRRWRSKRWIVFEAQAREARDPGRRPTAGRFQPDRPSGGT